MADDKGRYRDPTSVLKEIEDEIERLKSGRKEQIEKKLQEKILKERKDAADEISRVEKEFERDREEIRKYEALVADYERARAELQGRIQEHLNRIEQCRAEIAKSALAAATSLREVDRQNKKFRDLRGAVEERTVMFKKEIPENFEITVQLPERQDADELRLDVEGELAWFQKIIVDLESKPAVPASKPASPAPAKPEIKPEPRPEPKPAPAPASAPAADKTGKAGKPKDEAVLDVLKQYLKYDPTDHAGEMRYFQKDDKVLLDGEFIVAAIGDSLEATRLLYEKIGRTKSSKDQFFVKQEIVNRQEALRKVILRGVRMCENEDCQLPAFTLDIMNLVILKNILEMLNEGNWSTEEDFRYFVRYADRVKTAYYTRITPPAVYFATILSELES
jgi:cell division septation protein DedD